MDGRRKMLGRRLQRARRAAGYRSQKAFAEAIGVSDSSVARVELGDERVGIGDQVFTRIEVGLRLPDEITKQYLETGDPALLERVTFNPERDRPEDINEEMLADYHYWRRRLKERNATDEDRDIARAMVGRLWALRELDADRRARTLERFIADVEAESRTERDGAQKTRRHPPPDG